VSSIVDSIAGVVQPWADFYGHHKSVSDAITWLHLSALLVGGGAAVTADRRVLGLGNADTDDLRRGLSELARTHKTVIAALTVSVLTGVSMLLSDVKTFLVSPVYWTKMSLVLLLLLNGYVLMRTERRLGGDPSPTNLLWQRLSLGALASITLWVGITLAGVVLVNA
jgi:hypothetical protein